VNLSNLRPRHRVMIIAAIFSALVVGGSFFFVSRCNATKATKAEELKKLQDELKSKKDEVAQRAQLEQQLNEMIQATHWVRQTAADPEQIAELRKELGPTATRPILAKDYFSQLVKDLDFLAGLTDVTIERMTPKEYVQRKVTRKPTPKSSDPEDIKAADELWNSFPEEKKQKILRDEQYLAHLNELKPRAELWNVEMEITGTYSAIADFIHGLISDERTGWRFTELISIENIELRAEAAETEKANPVLRCRLNCVAFKLKPPAKPTPTPAPGTATGSQANEGIQGGSTGSGGSAGAGPGGAARSAP